MLDRVILDAAARRFQAHKIYLRAAAAKRWAMSRSNILGGQRPTQAHTNQLMTVSTTFRQVGSFLLHFMVELALTGLGTRSSYRPTCPF